MLFEQFFLISLFNYSSSEYDMTKSVFANSYPWLFPGGVGDVYDMKRGGWDVKEWGRHLLRYYDGR